MTAWRYIAARATTGEILHWDLPMSRDELTWALSGAGSLRGSIDTDTGALRADDGLPLLEEWGTFIYAEADGQIRWGGILISSTFDGDKWSLEAAGFSTYPRGIPYTGDYKKIGVDPADAIAEVWREIQTYPDGDLGITVTGSKTPVRLGTPAIPETSKDAGDGVEEEPYRLSWWDTKDAGTEIDALAKSTPLDYVESHSWSGDSAVVHEFRIGYPRLGRRRDDLAFSQGANIIDVVTVTSDGDDYANEIIGLGAGEAVATLRSTIGTRSSRLRRPFVYAAKDVNSPELLTALVRDELVRRSTLLGIESVTVVNHPNAAIGSWDLGDDVLIDVDVPWVGRVALWCRITAWSLLSEDTATLTLSRSDSFHYGG